MQRYLYSLVRYVPDPASGEFVNLGAIVGSEEAGDWGTRHVQNDHRARGLQGHVPTSIVYDFLSRVDDEIDRAAEYDDDAFASLSTSSPELTEDWLQDLYRRSRNVVQLSPPAPLVADDAESALDVIFDAAIADPARGHYRYPTKRAVFGDLRRMYRNVGLSARSLHERTRVTSRGYSSDLDFAVANGRVVQLAHTYSFGIASQANLASQVRSWGWTLRGLRQDGGSLLQSDGPELVIAADVAIDVVYALPEGGEDLPAFAEAKRVFRDLDISAHDRREGGVVAAHGRDLLARSVAASSAD